MKKTSTITTFALSALLLSCSIASAAVGAKQVDTSKVPEQYQHPIAAMPYAWAKPTIDGAVNDAEWQGAFSQMAMRSLQGQIATRQTRFWMMWDEENFYIAMRSPLRKGERPVQQYRDPSVDTDQIFDDCYEIWISAGQVDTPTGQLDCSAKFLSNVAGAHYDTIYQPNVGNERVGSYETGWKPKNSINDRNEWEMELVVPRASLGTTPGPFHDGQHVRVLMARNAKRGWSQDNFEGSNSFSVTDTHSLFVLSKTAPALHLLGVGDAGKGEVGMRLAAQGQSDMAIQWKFQSPDVTKDGKAQVAKDKLAEIVNDLAMDKAGEGDMRIMVTDDAGRPLLDWGTRRSFAMLTRPVMDANGNRVKDEKGKPVYETVNPANEVFDDKGDVIVLTTTYNPVRSYLKVQGDFINYDNRAPIRDIEVVVKDATGKEVGKTSSRLDPYAYAKDMIRFEQLPIGDYTVVIRCLDKEGKALESRETTFTVADLAAKYKWFNTKRGNIETVIKPWTPVTQQGNTLGVWGRDMTVGAAGLPAQITTQGRKLFSEPARLVASCDGKAIAATGVDAKTTFDKDYRKIIQVKSQLGDITVNSDVQVEFDGLYKVTMTLDPKPAATLDKLQVVLPLDEAMADYIHGSASEIRSGFYYGPMPAGKGKIWDCISLGDATMAKGSFVPYVWVGSPVGGLAWFADSDEGWVPSDTTPAIEIQRHKDGQIELVLNLISERFTLDKPRTITFGLQASPAKAMHDRWREEKWWCGDTFKEYARKGDIIWSSTPFPDKKYIEESKKLAEEQHAVGRPAVPYFIHSVLPRHLPEMTDLFDEWTTNDGEYGSKALCYRKTLNDFMVHSWGEWARDCGIDGYYVDNMRPIDCNKIEHGCGYRLPDGRVQPVYSMFGTREYFLRSRAAILEERPSSKLVLHMTNAMILPWIGAADVAYDGEHHVIYPRMKKDFMDFWQLDRVRVHVPPFLSDTPEVRAELAQYYQSISRLDRGIGRLVEVLRDEGQLDNTVLIYISDNGAAFPQAKTTLYEPGMALPCIVRSPLHNGRGTTCDGLITWTDLTPTILELAGVKVPGAAFHGRSFAGILDQASPVDWREEVFASHSFHEITNYYPMRVVRTKRYKFIYNIAWKLDYSFASDLWESASWQAVLRDQAKIFGARTVEAYTHRPRFEMYDLVNDPNEVINLAGRADYAGMVQAFVEKLKAFQQQTNDPWFHKWTYE